MGTASPTAVPPKRRDDPSGSIDGLFDSTAIVMVDFDPVVGSEAARSRPAIVVSNNAANAAATRIGGVVTVVPVTSNTARVHPFQVLLPSTATGLPRDSKAQAEQVRTVAVARVRSAAGWATTELMRELDAALRRHLAL